LTCVIPFFSCLLNVAFGRRRPERVVVLEFLLLFHSDGFRPSSSAILRCKTVEEALAAVAEIAKRDQRSIEIWRDQKMLGRFPVSVREPDQDF
jgi:hypothetical protein